MKSGDHVAVFDNRRGRWCQAQILSTARASAVVLARGWLGVVPILPAWLRPLRVVRA